MMADHKFDNTKLEEAMQAFVQDRQKDKYAAVMGILEKSVILVPMMKPEGLDEETERLMKEGKPVQLPKETKIMPCLLRNEAGEQALPIFTSTAQIPDDRRSPALMGMPFFGCLSMLMAGQGQVETMVLNPFTHNMVLTKAVLDVAVKRRDSLMQQQQQQQQQQKTVKVTEKQFQDIVHNRVALHLLPKYLFEQKEEGLEKLQKEEGAFLVPFYEEMYPEGRKGFVAVSQEDFSVMTLNLTEDMQMTRVDLPDKAMKKGMCYRVYVVRLRESGELLYYTLVQTEQGNQIGRVTADGKHELIEEAPDNGAEIEAVMKLAEHR